MAIVQIGDYGEKDGVRTYRIHGGKNDLLKIIEECRKEDANCFDDSPEIESLGRGCWTMLLKLKVAVEVGDEG